MKIALNKWSALYLLRFLRANRGQSHVLSGRADIVSPDPSPLHRWGKSCFAEGPGPLGRLPGQTLYVAVPSGDARLQSSHVVNTVYGCGIPAGSFIELADGIVISGPELLFVEMAALMHPVEHLMLGHELCGSFGRCAADPRNGRVAFSLPPLTSVERIRRFLDRARGIRGIRQARSSLERISDNTWSPTEALVAAFLSAPIDDMGFGLGPLQMNERVPRAAQLPGAKESRVPDILIGNTKVGLNYDGLAHLDLESVARAAMAVGTNPGSLHTERELKEAVRAVRAKVLDDAHRNRELAAGGFTVFPVFKEDLYQPGGLDSLVGRVVELLEQHGGLDLWAPKRALSSKALCEDRYRLLRSLLPGTYKPEAELGRYIAGIRWAEDEPELIECWIEI